MDASGLTMLPMWGALRPHNPGKVPEPSTPPPHTAILFTPGRGRAESGLSARDRPGQDRTGQDRTNNNNDNNDNNYNNNDNNNDNNNNNNYGSESFGL